MVVVLAIVNAEENIKETNGGKPMPQAEMHVVTDLETKALSYPDKARQLTINNPDDYRIAGEFVKAVDALGKEVEASFSPQIAQAHALHRSLIAERDRHLKPLTEAKTYARRLMVAYDQEQERKRREEEIRLRELARKAEEDAKLAAALDAEASGQTEEAQAILEEPVYVPPIIIKNETPKVQGVQFRTVWKFRVVDQRKIPAEYLIPDMVKIGAVVRALKQMTTIPGIEVYSEKS
jgi:hypothetical protein